MQEGYFQKAISALGLAVLMGVILFSVGPGSSATPEYAPPGTGVKPTFIGTKMLGSIENPNGDVVVDGDFRVKKIPGSALDKGDLTVEGGVYLNSAGSGGINLGATDGSSKIYVRGALDFLNNDMTKNVINHLRSIINHDTTNGLVLQAPGVRITLTPNKGIDITNAASTGASNGSKDLKGNMNVTVQGNLDLTGKIKDTKGDGTINVENHLDVLGTVFAMTVDADKIKNGTINDGGWVTVDDKFAVTQNSNFKGKSIFQEDLDVWDVIVNSSVSNEGAVKIDDALKANSLTTTDAVFVGGHLFLDHNAVWLSDDAWIHQLFKGPLSIKADYGKNIELNADKTVVNGKLTVTNGIGLILNYSEGWKTFSPGAVWKNFSYSYSCPSGYVAIACNYFDKNSDHDNVNVLDLYNFGSTCYINFDAKKNNFGENPQVKLRNSCWNASI